MNDVSLLRTDAVAFTDVDSEACRAYGALSEGVHVAGYTIERAFKKLEWLLVDGRWQQLGIEFNDVNAFVDSIKLDNLKIVADQRKRIADRIRKLQPKVSNRAIGRMLGVHHDTIDRDSRGGNPPDGSNSPADLRPNAGGFPPRPDPAAQRGQPLRDGPDFWPTPPCLIQAARDHVVPRLPTGTIWECAAGDGRLARGIGAELLTDKYPQDGSAPLDFIIDPPPATGLVAFTNQPFNTADEFLNRGLELLDGGAIRGLVLLLRHDHFMATGKVAALNRATLEVHCNWRPIWIDDTDGNPRWSFAWVYWGNEPRLPPLYLQESRG